jgi:ATP-dependent DNA helicase RecQ
MGAPTIEHARDALRIKFGFPGFRIGQERAIRATLEGRDTLTVLPTGGGKSLCYQVPAVVSDGLTLVFSPLISLMKDQVDRLRSRGVPVGLINSSISAGEQMDQLAAAEAGELKLLYLAPERLDSGWFQQRLARLGVRFVAVDEAHCISQWGHEFRPAYLRLSRIHDLVGRLPVMALTATATERVREEIVRLLELQDPVKTVAGFDRPNLHFAHSLVSDKTERERKLLDAIRRTSGAAIVYCSARWQVDAVVRLLSDAGIKAAGYHAGLSDTRRARVQDGFTGGSIPVVVATNAFGMGVDKPDVRTVVHYSMPGSVEAYYQEAGRAGRDGLTSRCLLLADPEYDAGVHRGFIDEKYPRRQHVDRLLRAARVNRAFSPGAAIPQATLLEKVAGADERRCMEGAITRLLEAGVLRAVEQPPRIRVRLCVAYDQLKRRAEEGELELLRTIYRSVRHQYGDGNALRGSEGVVLPWTAIGGRRVESLLNQVQEKAIIQWRDLAGTPDIWLAKHDATVDDALDWGEIERGRTAAEAMLEAMQRYVRTRQCRRAYILRYFGDLEASRLECSGCDRCDAEACAPKNKARRAVKQLLVAAADVPVVPRAVVRSHDFQVNDWVRHDTFGDGYILAFGGFDGEKAFVKFESGSKQILVTYLTRVQPEGEK